MAGRKTTARTGDAPAGRQATVFDAHDFVPADDAADPDAPHCAVCGSGEDAFIHTEEGASTSSTVVVNAVDAAATADRSSAG